MYSGGIIIAKADRNFPSAVVIIAAWCLALVTQLLETAWTTVEAHDEDKQF
jgi:hypothetical protein